MRKRLILRRLVILVFTMLGGLWLVSGAFFPPSQPPPQEGPETTTAIPVEVVKPERKEISRSLTIPGSFSAFEEVTLYAKVSGYMESIFVDIGDWVRKGQTVAVLDVPELSAEHESAKAELIRARAAVQRAESELLRCQADLELKQLTLDRLMQARKMEPEAIALQEVDVARGECEMAIAAAKVAEGEIGVARAQVEVARAGLERLSQMLKYSRIVAPFSGFVTQRHVHPGALIPQGTAGSEARPVVTLARTDTLRFFTNISEPDVPFIEPGETSASIQLDALPGRTFQGRVTRISQSLNPQTRTMLVEIDLPNREGVLKPGMYGNAELHLYSNRNALVIPPTAILMESGQPHVLQVVGSEVEKVAIRLGSDDGVQVEVLEGLDESDSIVVSGKNLVKPGDTVIPHGKGGEHVGTT